MSDLFKGEIDCLLYTDISCFCTDRALTLLEDDESRENNVYDCITTECDVGGRKGSRPPIYVPALVFLWTDNGTSELSGLSRRGNRLRNSHGGATVVKDDVNAVYREDKTGRDSFHDREQPYSHDYGPGADPCDTCIR